MNWKDKLIKWLGWIAAAALALVEIIQKLNV